ncbi:MAG: endonuclease/exonuclease/phosphatase family protein [Bacteroidales bacterium]|nr:endonuclease/exonuclease/phosphatase family protein [Bacteroidales bacterium]
MMIIGKVIKHTLYTANIIALLLLLLSSFSDRISPQTWLLPSFLGIVFPLFLIINLVFLVIWLLSFRWKAILGNMCILLLCWGSIHTYYPINILETKKLPEKPIKLMTYNIMGFAYKGHTKEKPNPIIEYIQKEDPDIICLQEYIISKVNKKLNDAVIRKAFRDYPYKKAIYFDRNDAHDYGIVVYSKYPITGSERINYESTFNGSGLFYIKIGDKKLALINNHLESNRITKKDKEFYNSLSKGSINTDKLELLKNNIVSRLKPAFLQRAIQADSIAKKIKELNTDYILVCGDLNDTPISYARHTIQGPLIDAYTSNSTGPGISYNADHFWFRIDYIFHSPRIRTYQCRTDRSIKTSDHYPLWCYFTLE